MNEHNTHTTTTSRDGRKLRPGYSRFRKSLSDALLFALPQVFSRLPAPRFVRKVFSRAVQWLANGIYQPSEKIFIEAGESQNIQNTEYFVHLFYSLTRLPLPKTTSTLNNTITLWHE